ncbi:WD repeat-containing protein 89 isoform X2 [Pygocentrus nattereri]|nr:WD repeat-containing protein 89 isoform X2 [Pygocentrus nattereri]XP_017538868.1 WD repeat-containing protein 89 isoform X2 [Pygocentrus nattereri]
MDSLEDTFRTLSIARRLQPDDPSYILDLALPRRPGSSTSTPGPDLLAACCSTHNVRLHSRETLRMCGEYQGHTGAVFGVRFSSSSCDLIYTGSADGTLRCWDIRRPGSAAAQVFRSDPEHAYCSFDVSCNDRLLCAGTEQVGEDSFLVFWDARMVGDGGNKTETKQDRLLGVFSESHSDDITTVCFHPSRADRLASGATDGLVNVFDLSLGEEDDALVTTCNCESSAGSLCWSGTDLDRLLCLSHDEGLHLWDLSRLDSDDPLTLLGSLDARTLVSLPEGASLDYFVGGTWLEDEGHLILVGGSHEGELHLLECCGSGLKLMTSLKGGHSATVRCFQWDPVSGALLTGAEDGELLQWKAGAEEISVGKKGSLKSISSMQLKTKAHRKHVTKRDQTLTA